MRNPMNPCSEYSNRFNTPRVSRASTTQQTRRKNLRALIRERGATSIAKRLGYSGPSYLSQMTGPSGRKPVSETTARFIEEQLLLPQGWLDMDHERAPQESKLLSEVIVAIGTALEKNGIILPPLRMAELVGLAYEHAAEHDRVDEKYIQRLVTLANR